MRLVLIIIGLAASLLPRTSGIAAMNTTFPPAPAGEVCELMGSVYIEEVAAFANYRVFVDDIESFADLVVYKENTEAFATQPGHWYITDNKGFADFTIYIESVKGFADFSIAYTEFQTAAGCN